ncbi:unnamed protein product [Rotaria sp. Silwood2]|nr:unnamed protein product [Rotaria sp. Silwood2]CAF4692038.1 unnamed protein product [Rotaria sp. Silwood2]
MNTWVIMNVILNLLTLINSILTILICSFIFLLIIIFHRRSHSVPVLLAGHTCSALLISAFMLASMATASLFGYMNIVLEQHRNNIWCRLRGFCIHGFLCALYDSISPVLLRGDVIYLPSEYYCQTPFTNIPAIVYIAIRLFLLPIMFIALIYLCLLRYVRQSNLSSTTMNDNHNRRSKQNKRDLIVIRRLLLMLSVLILLGLPSMIFLTIFMFTAHLICVTYRVGWLSVSFSLVFLAYMLIQLTDPLKKTLRRHFKRSFLRQNRHPPPSKRQISLHGQ